MIWPVPCYAVLSTPVMMYVFLMPSTRLVNHWLQLSIPARCDSGSSHGTHVYVYECIPNSPSSLIRLLSIVHPWFLFQLTGRYGCHMASQCLVNWCWLINDVLWHSTEVISLEMPKTFINKVLWCILSSSQLTHWGRVTHICVCKLTSIGSDNGLWPGRHQAIIWTSAGILLIWP